MASTSGVPGHGAAQLGPATLGEGVPASTSFRKIADKYISLSQVQQALRAEGLEACNLVIAVDFTVSNKWSGRESFGGRSLHAVGDVPSPYEEAIRAIGRTLSAYDKDGFISAYGFGDSLTQDKAVFSFREEDRYCRGLNHVLSRYRELCPHVHMDGPTSFAPAIRRASSIVRKKSNTFHILLLLADGQVTRASGLPPDVKSEQEQETIDAIVEASNLPLSIIMVGVGDGPWDLMKKFDDELPQRTFDNFQFVNFTEVMAETAGASPEQRDAVFATRALMEVPEQYQAIKQLGLLGRSPPPTACPSLPPLDPPVPPELLYGAAPSAHRDRVISEPGQSAGASAAQASSPAAAAPSVQHARPGPQASGGGAGGAAAQQGRGHAGRAASGSSAPSPMFMCPITHSVMDDPVIASDGQTYERAAITAWLARSKLSPLTNQPMPNGATLFPNHQLRSAIMEWRQDNDGA